MMYYSDDEKLSIERGGRISRVEHTLAALRKDDIGVNSEKAWSNSYALHMILKTIDSPHLTNMQINDLYERIIDYKYNPN